MPNPDTSSAQSSATASSAGTSGARSMAQQAAERVREETGRVAGQAKQQAQTFVSQQKDLVADRVTDVADVLRETVGQLDERVPGAIANYAHQAIDRLDDAASYLREQDLNSLIADAENFARRQPLLFLAGSMAVGFALARFLKSSARHGGHGRDYSGTASAYSAGEMSHGAYGPGTGKAQPSAGYGGAGVQPDRNIQGSDRSSTGSAAGTSASAAGSGRAGSGSTPGSFSGSASPGGGSSVPGFGSSPAAGTAGVRGASGQGEATRKSGSPDTSGTKR